MGVAEIRSEVAGIVDGADRVAGGLREVARTVAGCHSSVAHVTTGSRHGAALGARDVLASLADLSGDCLALLAAGSQALDEYSASL